MRQCVVCGCSELAPCVDSETGETCGWSYEGLGIPDMCTFCEEAKEEERALDYQNEPLVVLASEGDADRFLRSRRASA